MQSVCDNTEIDFKKCEICCLSSDTESHIKLPEPQRFETELQKCLKKS